MNFFNQGIPLGRWFRIQVILHWTFLLFAASEIFGGSPTSQQVTQNALLIGLLFIVVILHEFGHALSCRAMGGDAHQIVLWPLGGIAFVRPPMNPTAWLVTTACGPLVNAILWPAFFFISRAVVIGHYGDDVWALILDEMARGQGRGIIAFAGLNPASEVCLYLWQINKLLLLFNLFPAYPMDGGRLLQEVLWFGLGYQRSRLITGMVGTVAGAGLAVIGMGLRTISIPAIGFTLGGEPNIMLVIIGALCALQSFAIYRQSQRLPQAPPQP